MRSNERSSAALVLLLAVVACGCATYDAIVTAPPSFWLTMEGILIALWTDLENLVGFIL